MAVVTNNYASYIETPQGEVPLRDDELREKPLGGGMKKIVELGLDGLVEGYYFDANGDLISNSASAYTEEYIEVKPSNLYLIVARVLDSRSIIEYNAEKKFVKSTNNIVLGDSINFDTNSFFVITTPETKFIRFSIEFNANYGGPWFVYEVCSFNNIISELENVSSELENVSSELENVSSELEITPLTDEVDLRNYFVEGTHYIEAGGSLQNGFRGDNATDFIDVEPNTGYTYKGRFSDSRGFALYSSNKRLVYGTDGNLEVPTAPHVVTEIYFETPENAVYARFSCYESGGTTEFKLYKGGESAKGRIIKNSERIEVLEEEVFGSDMGEDYEYNFPTVVYGIDNDASNNFFGFDFVQNLYVEGLVSTSKALMINGGRRAILQTLIKNTQNVEETDFDITLSGDGYVEHSGSVKLVKTKASVANGKTIKYLAIGDSITANQAKNLKGDYDTAVCYQSFARKYAEMYKIDLSSESMNFITVGTANRSNRDFEYKDKTIRVTNYGEGRGSWTTADYLRHALSATGKGNALEGSSNQIQAGAAWLSLGLATKQSISGAYNQDALREDWVQSDEQIELIRTTPHGKYHWDYGEDLWTWVTKSYEEYSGDYVGSDEQNQAIDTVMNDLFDNPKNPFFDKNIAKYHDYAFSMSTYLSRYKTLAEDGITRLIVGETAGSKVTNAESYDVCTPTHVTIELSENDRWWYSMEMSDVVDDLIQLGTLIKNDVSGAIIGYVVTRSPGVYSPEKWSDLAKVRQSVGSQYKWGINKLLSEKMGEHDDFYLIPTFETHNPLDNNASSTRYDIDTLTGKEIIVSGNDRVHPGYLSYQDMGYQILSWIYYTLTL